MYRIDGPGATSDHKFTDGNPLTGVPATRVSAEFLNLVQEEICYVIEHNGGDLDRYSTTQLYDAILSMITGGGDAVTAAAVSIADAGNVFESTNVEGALQELADKVINGLIASGKIRRTGYALTGAANSAATGHLENVVKVSHTTATTYTIGDDTALPAPLWSQITVFQTGAGKVTIAGASGVTIQRPASFNPRTMEQFSALVVIKVAPNTWRVGGTMGANT